MALVKKKTASQEPVFNIKKIALAVVTRTKVKVEKSGPNAFLLTYKKKASKFHIRELVHRSQIVAISGGETDFDGTVTYRGIDTVYDGRGTISEIDANGITFVDANGSTHFVPAGTDSGIVMSIVTDGIDLAAVAKAKPVAKAPKKVVKVKKSRNGALPHPKSKE